MNFHYEKLKSPEFFCENRLPAHSDHEAFACLEDLETGENRLRLCLNGPWKFFYALNEEQVVPGFEKLEYDCSAWADISVPAHIHGRLWCSAILQYPVSLGRQRGYCAWPDSRAL